MSTTPPRKHAIAGWGIAPLFAWVLALLIGLSGARGAEIMLVISGDAVPYQQAQEGATERLEREKHHVRAVSLAEVSAKGADATIGASADAVVAVGTPAACWLHKQLPANRTLVYCLVADPTSAGLTQGQKTYGITTEIPLAQQFALLAEGLPQARTMGMLYRSDTPEGNRLLGAVKDALPSGWQLVPAAVDKAGSVPQAIDELTRQHVDVVWTSADSTIYDAAGVRALLLASLRKRIPVFGFSAGFVRAGALLGVSVDPKSQGTQAADMVERLFKNPADPTLKQVVGAESCQLAVNLIVADKLGLVLPESFVGKAFKAFKEER